MKPRTDWNGIRGLLRNYPHLASTAIATPWLVFTIFPVRSVFAHTSQTGPRFTILATIILWSVLYSCAYLIEDYATISTRHAPIILTILGILFLLQLTLAFRSHDGSAITMLIYMGVIAATQLVPFLSRLTLPLIFLSGFIQAIYFNNINGWVPLVILIAVSLGVYLGASETRNNRRQSVSTHERTRMAREAERSRISSDLHDIVGQTLTATSVKATATAQLLGRLDKNLLPARQVKALDMAMKEATAVANLASELLGEVRLVVAGQRTMNFADEVADALSLAEAAWVNIEIDWDSEELAKDPASIMNRFGPYVLRESIANVIHHARAKNCWVIITPNRLVVRDDGDLRGGYPQGSENTAFNENAELPLGHTTPPRSGTGLVGLAARVNGYGQLSWGKYPTNSVKAHGWQVEFRVDS